MLLAVYLYEDLVDVEGIAIASVLMFQPASIDCSEFDASKSNCFAPDYDASLRE